MEWIHFCQKVKAVKFLIFINNLSPKKTISSIMDHLQKLEIKQKD